jgi:hypothetical protein
MSSKITLTEILRGTKPGNMQSVGIMQVIPLTGEYYDDRFVSPKSSKVSTRGYGKLDFENTTDSLLIIPSNASYIVKEKAQDHAMARAGIVGGRQSKTYDNAMCIQQTQSGLIASGDYKMMILPFSLREAALELRDVKEYNKLWKYIDKFNKQFSINVGGELVHFFSRFEKELDTFVAEFENIPGQVGAVILINGEVVGIERAPSEEYWNSVWTALIRECYGSLAVEISRLQKEVAAPPETRAFVRKADSLEDLKEAVNEAKEKEKRIAAEKINELFVEEFKVKTDEKLDDIKVQTVESRDFTGQVIRDSQRVVYSSVIATQYRMKNRSWNKEPGFSVGNLIDKLFN